MKTLITHPNFKQLWKKLAEKNNMDFPEVVFENLIEKIIFRD